MCELPIYRIPADNSPLKGVLVEGVIQRPIRRFYQMQPAEERIDTLSIEEPIEMRLCAPEAKPIAITMRTPGHDIELAAGFLFNEGIIQAKSDLASIERCEKNSSVISIRTHTDIDMEQFKRHFYTTSSCGVCGKVAISALKTQAPFSILSNWTLEPSQVLKLQEQMRQVQRQFQSTGGLHASAIFDRQGQLRVLREDVGRHNALDKAIGWALLNDSLPLSDHVLLLSGRASFELIQKSAMAGIGLVVAIGAPSSMAVELAEEMNITLIGFAKEDRFNVYTHEERIQ